MITPAIDGNDGLSSDGHLALAAVAFNCITACGKADLAAQLIPPFKLFPAFL